MKLLSFEIDGRASYGALREREVVDLGARLGAETPDLKSLLCRGLEDVPPLLETAGPGLALDTLRFLPVIPNPAKILCAGLNYEDHRLEVGLERGRHPSFFVRFPDTQMGHGSPIVLPKVSHKVDYEGELAVIIGQAGRYITEDQALGHVAGYACYQDASVRDWQGHSKQFTSGKNFPATGGFGPWLVTRDELPQLAGLTLETRLNGKVMQHAKLSLMIFSVAELVSYVSSFTPLAPGDVIITGTPAGVGFVRNPRLYLAPSDVVEVEISGIGVLRNPVVAEPTE
jgi:2-keto-4-pentenoate hydratase/2-oxohepta-3-ene-1,7-dioic acid hydratase in catechol pathway